MFGMRGDDKKPDGGMMVKGDGKEKISVEWIHLGLCIKEGKMVRHFDSMRVSYKVPNQSGDVSISIPLSFDLQQCLIEAAKKGAKRHFNKLHNLDIE